MTRIDEIMQLFSGLSDVEQVQFLKNIVDGTAKWNSDAPGEHAFYRPMEHIEKACLDFLEERLGW